MVSRLTFLSASFAIAFAAVLFHLYQIQLTQGEYYAARATSTSPAAQKIINRGTMYATDKNGNTLPVATNKNFPLIYAAPKAIDDLADAARRIAPLLGIAPEALLRQLSKPADAYELLKRKADPAIAQKVEDEKIKGIYVDTVPERWYPFGKLAAQVIGFVGPNAADAGIGGHYGLEEFYNGAFAGVGSKTSNAGNVPPAGENLTLTLDPNIQTEAERILNNVVDANHAAGGSVIVEDPQTGKILAMGSYPNFDPNNYGGAPIADFLNPVVQQIYEPGSIFKVITMAAGIDSGKLTSSTTYIDAGKIILNGRTIQNYDLKTHGPYGTATMTNVIEHSINTGAVFAESRIGRDIFTAYIHKFGFAEKTGIDLPGELKGDLRRLSPKERDVAFATASYGQGVAVTPIELVNSIAAIANGGMLMRPYLNAALAPKEIRRVVSRPTAKAVTGMMISAVDKAHIASVAGYSIAGKTGSAFIPDFKKGGYTNTLIDSYAGFGPTTNPRFVILFKVNGLDESQLAATIIVPAFHDLAQFILNYYNVPPDRL